MTFLEQTSEFASRRRSLESAYEESSLHLRLEVSRYLRAVAEQLQSEANGMSGEREEEFRMMAARAASLAGQLESGRRTFASMMEELNEKLERLGVCVSGYDPERNVSITHRSAG